MVNRLTAILLLMLVSLVAVIAVELHKDARVAGRPGAGIESSQINEQSFLDLLRISLPPLSSLTETTARPLFVETRKPSPEAPAPVAPMPVDVGEAPDISISAIVITEKERVVLVKHPVSGALVRMREGERIIGWTLDRVEPGRAVFSKEGTSRSATLRTFGPPVMSQSAPRPAGGALPGPSLSEPRLRPPRRLSPQSVRQPDQ